MQQILMRMHYFIKNLVSIKMLKLFVLIIKKKKAIWGFEYCSAIASGKLVLPLQLTGPDIV